MKPFKSPKRSIGDLDAKTAARLLAGVADLALVVDEEGTIRDVAFGPDVYDDIGCADWIGKPWRTLVTVESVVKIDEIMRSAKVKLTEPRWRQVNHLTNDNDDLPIRYQAIRLKNDGPILVFGRDMTHAASLQQRLLDVQTQLEREYARLAQVETRYRALFQSSVDAILVVDAASLEVTDANQACVNLFANGTRTVVGRRLPDLIHPQYRDALATLLAEARTKPRAEPIVLKGAHYNKNLQATVGVFRDGDTLHYLVRLVDIGESTLAAVRPTVADDLQNVLERMPDAFVMVDDNFCIMTANSAFLEFAELAAEDQVRGQPIHRWLGRVEIDTAVLFASLAERGSVARYNALLRGEYGARHSIEISGVAAPGDNGLVYGLIIHRDPAPMPEAGDTGLLGEAGSADKLKELVGRTPLRDLVRQTTDIVERMCIEAALELTGDNRASAAEMLGLSRQSLYLKLRRHNIGGLGESDDDLR